jgi:hypothetical protein
MAENDKAAATEAAQQTGGQQVRVAVDERSMQTSYANAFRANATAEEVVLDFGVNLAGPAGGGAEAPSAVFQVNQRVILNYFSAKRLAITMGQIIRTHEQQYGELELDAAKRVRKQ